MQTHEPKDWPKTWQFQFFPQLEGFIAIFIERICCKYKCNRKNIKMYFQLDLFFWKTVANGKKIWIARLSDSHGSYIYWRSNLHKSTFWDYATLYNNHSPNFHQPFFLPTLLFFYFWGRKYLLKRWIRTLIPISGHKE